MFSQSASEYQYRKLLLSKNASFQTLQSIIIWACTNEHNDLVKEAFYLALEKDQLPNHEILINKTLRDLKDIELAWEILMYAHYKNWANVISYTTLIEKTNRTRPHTDQEREILMQYAEIAYGSIPIEQNNDTARNTMLMNKVKLAGIDSAVEFFNSIHEDHLTSVIFTTMISIYFWHRMPEAAHALYNRAINTKNFARDPELHATLVKFDPKFATTVYEIAARANAVHDKMGRIISSHNALSKQIGSEVHPLQEVEFHPPVHATVSALSQSSRSSFLETVSSSSHSSLADKASKFLLETSSIRSKTPSQSSIDAEFEEEIQRYRDGFLGDSFTTHLDMLDKAAKNKRVDILKEAFTYAYKKDHTNHQLLFNRAMKSANECNIELTHHYYLQAIKEGIANIAFHSLMVKYAGEHANFALAMEAYKNGLTPSKPGEPIPPAPLSPMPANTLNNTMILAIGNCKRLDKASLIYKKMIDAKEKSLAKGENDKGITDMITHSSMMAAAVKSDSFEMVVEAFNNAIKYNEHSLLTFYKMMSISGEKGSRSWLNYAYSKAITIYPEDSIEIDQRYEKSLAQLQISIAVQKNQKTQDEQFAPGSLMAELSSDILAGLEEDEQPVRSPEASGLLLRKKEPNNLQDTASCTPAAESKTPAKSFLKALEEQPSAWNRKLAATTASSSRDIMFPALPSRLNPDNKSSNPTNLRRP